MNTKKTIIVTGSTGLIGSHVIPALAARGDRAIAFARNTEKARAIAPGAAEYVQWDSSSRDGAWLAKVDEADAIVNLAGSPIAARWTEQSKQEMFDSRVSATENIARALRAASPRPRVLVNGSAVGYYGAARPERVTEESQPGTDFTARLAVAWERAALEAETEQTRVVLLRTGLVLAKEGGALEQMLPAFRLFVGGPLGNGRQPFPWIHIADEVGIILWALDNPQVSGPINAVAPGIVDNRQFSHQLGKTLQRPSALPVPKFALKLLFGEGSEVIVNGQNAIPAALLKLGYEFQYPELKAALKDVLEK